MEDERKPGEMIEKSFIEVRNFVYNPEGDYFSVTINNVTKMVKLKELFDENGKEITDLTDMIGKKLTVKIDGKVVGTTEPLTYEQAHMAYETVKTFQETELVANENSYLRLKNGEYVKDWKLFNQLHTNLSVLKMIHLMLSLLKKLVLTEK